MIKALKVLHLLGLVLFLGSIPGHILLGSLAASLPAPEPLAILQAAKHASTSTLTLPGLGLVVSSGLVLTLHRRELLGAGWMRFKLGLTVLVVMNALLVLAPVGAEIATAAAAVEASGTIPPSLATLQWRESVFGSANVAMTLLIIVLAVVRPRLCVRPPSGVSARTVEHEGNTL